MDNTFGLIGLALVVFLHRAGAAGQRASAPAGGLGAPGGGRAQQAGCAWCSTMRRTEPSRTVSV
jgi:hypothetical protein